MWNEHILKMLKIDKKIIRAFECGLLKYLRNGVEDL